MLNLYNSRLVCLLPTIVNLSHNGFSHRSRTFHYRFFCSRQISLLLVAVMPMSRSFFLLDMLLLTLSTAYPGQPRLHAVSISPKNGSTP